MNKDLAIFTTSLLLLAVVIGLVTMQIANPSFLFLILGVLTAATWPVYFFLQSTKSEDLVKNYLLTIVLKLLSGGVFIFILLYKDKSGADANAIFFMIAYLLFTGLEVGFLFKGLG